MADATHNPSFTRSGSAWSEVTALTDNLYRIRLGGMLRSSWMIGVCTGLANAHVSIDRAHARRLAHDGSWIAELHVLALPGAPDPLQLPLIEFAQTPNTPAGNDERGQPALAHDHDHDHDHAQPLCLHDYELAPSGDHGGTLHLTLSAQDSVGLLSSLLAAFASLALLPVEMHIETRGSEAHDCLWLASRAEERDGRPNDADFHALGRLLTRSLRH
ncbi:MAG: hypothetical protein RL701_3772 [Pseudomonadota bacterium]|jgi:hypothetical protein